MKTYRGHEEETLAQHPPLSAPPLILDEEEGDNGGDRGHLYYDREPPPPYRESDDDTTYPIVPYEDPAPRIMHATTASETYTFDVSEIHDPQAQLMKKLIADLRRGPVLFERQKGATSSSQPVLPSTPPC